MYRVVFVDIDGTLRDSNKNISERTINAIKDVTNKGILVVLCSGRPRKYTEDISKQCFASKYIITSGGGNIYDYEEGKLLYVNSMDKEALIELYEIAERAEVSFMMDVGENRTVNKVKRPGEEVKLRENIRDFVYKNDIAQCTIADNDLDKIKELVPEIEKLENVEIKNRHQGLFDIRLKDNRTVYCDIANVGSGKGVAVKKLLEILSIKKEEAIAIGDGVNDLSMFKEAGYKVAVENAMEVLKNEANEITKSNNENGVAVFLEKLVN